MSVGRSAIQLQASKITQTVLAFAASLILARELGPHGTGIYASVLALAVIVQGVASFGFEDLVLARGPRNGGDTPLALGLYRLTLRVRIWATLLLVAVGAGILASGIGDPFGSGETLTFASAFFYAGLNGIATLGATVQAARLKPGVSAALDTCWSLLVTASYGVLAAVGQLSVETALVATTLAQVVIDLGYMAMLFGLMRSKHRKSLRRKIFSQRDSFTFWLNGLLSIGVGKTTDVLAIRGAGAGATDIGLYNSAFNAFQTASQALLQGIGTISYVGFGRAFSREHPDETAAAWRTTVVVAVIVSAPVLMLTAIFSGRILDLLYGPPFAEADSSLTILAACGLASRIIGGGSNQAMLFLAERQYSVLTVRGTMVTINVFLDILLYKQFGLIGVAYASGLCGVAVAGIEFYLSRRIAPIRIPIVTAAKITAPYLVSGLLVRYTFKGDSAISTLSGLALSAILGSSLLVLIRPIAQLDLTVDPSSKSFAAVLLKRISHA